MLQRTALIAILLIFVIPVAGQRNVDTFEIYNGKLTRKRIEYNSKGEYSKEIYFYPNGKRYTEYFLVDNKRVRWIAFDTKGKIIAEWNDPEITRVKHRNLRNTILLIETFCVLGLLFLGRRKHYTKIYYFFLCLTVVYPVILLFLEQRFLLNDEHSIVLKVSLASMLIIIPGVLLVLSVVNLVTKPDIPLIISVFGFLTSAVLLFFFTLIASISFTGVLS